MTRKRIIQIVVVVLVAVGIFLWTRPGKLSQAEAFFHSFQYDQALAEYQKALENEDELTQSEREMAYFGVARSLHKLGRHEEAIKAYEHAQELFPQSREANTAEGEIQRIKLHHDIK